MALSRLFPPPSRRNSVSPAGRAKQRSRHGPLRRVVDAMVASRLQQIDSQIARYLEGTGENSPTRLSARLKSVFIRTAGTACSELTGGARCSHSWSG